MPTKNKVIFRPKITVGRYVKQDGTGWRVTVQIPSNLGGEVAHQYVGKYIKSMGHTIETRSDYAHKYTHKVDLQTQHEAVTLATSIYLDLLRFATESSKCLVPDMKIKID
jgi:hypothetical protein